MDEGDEKSRIDNLRKEFSLLWQSILGESSPPKGFSDEGELLEKLESLDPEKLKTITKSLSDTRRLLHQKLERVKKEIDLQSAKSESLRLVGGDLDETLRRISELNGIGQNISNQLFEIDEQLRIVRNLDAVAF